MTFFQLFWSFCKIGFTSFGGLSMIPLINSEMLSNGWMTSAEVSDIIAVAEMTPGPVGLNCATFAGIRVGGIMGALAANFGIIMPTLTICAVIAVFFERFRNSRIMSCIMFGVRPVCIGIMVTVMIDLCKTNYVQEGQTAISNVVIGGIAAFLLLKRKFSVQKVIFLSGILGIVSGTFSGVFFK